MSLIFASPSPDDLIRLLKAWRFWLLGAVAGALMGTMVYLIAPPTYRGQATVNVDFHMEQAWPQNSDREQFYYLERETRKLEEIALSDAVIQKVVSETGIGTVQQLREKRLQLSQPGNGGWHFYADDRDAHKAAMLAATWARAFTEAVQTQVAQPSSPLEQFITTTTTQTETNATHRVGGLSVYMFGGALILVAFSGLGILYFQRPG
jgi:capsular polysaccharide biosynthesis protein